MRKCLVFLLILISCGGDQASSEPIEDISTTSSTTTLGTTTTTSQNNLRTLKIAIFDDSMNKKYDVISVSIVKPKKFLWSPDLEYGADDLLIPAMLVGEIGEFILTFDNESRSIPICFSPTFDSKGDMGTIWIVLNDDNIEIDGLPIQDIVVTRESGVINNLSDNSKPNCNSTSSTSTTIRQSDILITFGIMEGPCPEEIKSGQNIEIIYYVEAIGSAVDEVFSFWSWDEGQTEKLYQINLPKGDERAVYKDSSQTYGGSTDWFLSLNISATNRQGVTRTKVCEMLVIVPESGAP